MISSSCCGKEFVKLEVMASNCFRIMSQMCVYKALHDLAPTDLSSADPWMYLLSVSSRIFFHLPGSLFFPWSCSFPLLTPNKSSLQRGHPELLAQVSILHFPLCNLSHTSHYLRTVCSQKCSAVWGQGLWRVFPEVVAIARAWHGTWPIWVSQCCCMKEQKDECEMQVTWVVGKKDRS